MSKTRISLLCAAALRRSAAPASAGVVGRDARRCAAGKPSVQVQVSGFKRASGSVKLALYDNDGYLEKGRKLRKVDVPVRSASPLDICIAVPRPGRYAVAVHHDLNGNGDRDVSDGGGYSGNPRLSITNLKPSFRKTAIEVGAAPRRVGVQLQYLHGLSIVRVEQLMARRIALISNPKSTGNLAQLPRIRAFCAEHPDIFHYEVEEADQIGDALKTIARVEPKMLVINGGDGTVQAALTELTNGRHFGDTPPPVAVLPNGKTNLIALDLGARGDPVEALERLLEFAQNDLAPHLVARELIALRYGAGESIPVIGMFLGGAGLADTMLYCRNKIYPLGLPNGLSHVADRDRGDAAAVVQARRALPAAQARSPLRISVRRDGHISGRFSVLAVTTLEKIAAVRANFGRRGRRAAQVPRRRAAVELGAAGLIAASLAGRLGRSKLSGVHIEEADEISIEGDSSDVILDGEMFRAEIGRPIFLKSGVAAVVRPPRRLSAARGEQARDPRRRGTGAAGRSQGHRARNGDRQGAWQGVARGPVLRLLPAREAARRADARFLPDRFGLSRRPMTGAG